MWLNYDIQLNCRGDGVIDTPEFVIPICGFIPGFIPGLNP